MLGTTQPKKQPLAMMIDDRKILELQFYFIDRCQEDPLYIEQVGLVDIGDQRYRICTFTALSNRRNTKFRMFSQIFTTDRSSEGYNGTKQRWLRVGNWVRRVVGDK